MLNPKTLNFLKQLKSPKRNAKAWVDAHREECDAAKADLAAFAERLWAGVAKFDALVKRAPAKPGVTRLNRDVRFHGGLPYRFDPHVVINARGIKAPTPYYFVHVNPGHVAIGAGVFAPESPDLRRFREVIADDPERFLEIIKAKPFRASFSAGLMARERGKAVPRGFDADNPAAEYLKWKSFYVSKALSERDLTSKAGERKILKTFESAAPLVDFLSDAFTIQPGRRTGRAPTPKFPD